MKETSMIRPLTVAIVAAMLVFALASVLGTAGAQPKDAGITTADPPKPSASIDDPTESPGAYVSDVQAAKRYGWPLVVLVLLRGLLAVAGRWVPWLRAGKNALIVAGGATVVSAAFDTIVMGGTWVAAAMAAVSALFWYLDPAHHKPAEPAG